MRSLDRLAELSSRGRADAILWSPSQRGPLRARRHVVTVHDCINVEYVYAGDWRLPALKWASQKLLGNAEVIVTISNATKHAVLRNYQVDPASIIVIQSPCQVGIPEDLTNGGLGSAQQALPDRPYVLMVTNSLPHKNTVRACSALARVGIAQQGIALLVIGSLPVDAVTVCREAGIDLRSGKHVSDATLRALYEGCLFLLSPSLDEGHDLPVAEAIALGGNVLCSDIPAHREFFEGLVEFFDPNDTDAMVAAVEHALMRVGRWFPSVPRRARSWADVASDYQRLFSTIQ